MFFGPNLHKKMGHYEPRPKWKTIFLAEITKADHQLSKTFHFIKISYVLSELWIFFYLDKSWLMLFVKKCHFQLLKLVFLISTQISNLINLLCSMQIKIRFAYWTDIQFSCCTVSIFFTLCYWCWSKLPMKNVLWNCFCTVILRTGRAGP